jgi:hypothetical protein
MAIIRGGKRIGGIDVRIGIPRDRSLDNVTGDPRLKQKPGGNSETTMGRFQSYVNEAEGFARKARYYVEFGIPKGVSATTYGDFDGDQEAAGFTGETQMFSMAQTHKRRVQAFCSALEMPNRTSVSKEIRHNGPARKFVYDYKSEPITMTFYTDKFMRERTYFEMWQKAAFSNVTHNYNYYDNYVTPVDIYQLGSFASRQERDDVTYAIRLYDCYPSQISAVSYTAESNDIQTFTVTFDFRYWVNYFIDRQGGIDVGSPDFRDVTIKENPGLFGGLLGKLPPEIRRAGRQVIEDLGRRLPTGRVTGGRVFPPYRIPPLKI